MASWTGPLCAALAGLAVFLALRHPAGQLRRMRSGTSKVTVVAASLGRLIRGPADAPPLVRRMLLSAACAAGAGTAAARSNLPGALIWFRSSLWQECWHLAGLSPARGGAVGNS
jgi:hypothetical protein